MKTFKVTVDGQSYTVRVEEMKEDDKQGSPETPDHRTSGDPAARTQTGPAPARPEAAAPVNDQPKKSPPPGGSGAFNVKAPMPGSILEVKVSVGDTIKNGDVLLVLEAMKMENELTASQAGTVKEVLVKKGDTVNSGDPLIVLS